MEVLFFFLKVALRVHYLQCNAQRLCWACCENLAMQHLNKWCYPWVQVYSIQLRLFIEASVRLEHIEEPALHMVRVERRQGVRNQIWKSQPKT